MQLEYNEKIQKEEQFRREEQIQIRNLIKVEREKLFQIQILTQDLIQAENEEELFELIELTLQNVKKS